MCCTTRVREGPNSILVQGSGRIRRVVVGQRRWDSRVQRAQKFIADIAVSNGIHKERYVNHQASWEVNRCILAAFLVVRRFSGTNYGFELSIIKSVLIFQVFR
jgi:hypothetical protein